MTPQQTNVPGEVVKPEAAVPDRVLARVERVAEVRERARAVALAREGDRATQARTVRPRSEAVGLKCRSGLRTPGHFSSTSTFATPAASASASDMPSSMAQPMVNRKWTAGPGTAPSFALCLATGKIPCDAHERWPPLTRGRTRVC